MPNSTPWCSASGNCRLEWRPSRWLLAALALIAVLAPLAVLASELPRPWAWPLASVSACIGLVTLWREARRPPRTLDWPLPGATLHWRGPLLFLRAPGLSLSWWPDTLDAGLRRELRVAAELHRGSGGSRDSPAKRIAASAAPTMRAP